MLCSLDGTGKKRKASGKNSSESSSQLEEGTEVNKSLQVNFYFPHQSHNKCNLALKKRDSSCPEGAAREGERKGDPTGCQPGVLQTVLQRAGHRGSQYAAVWPAVPLSAGL